MLPRRLRSTFLNRASGFVTTIALQKKLCAFATAKATHSISIPSQLICLRSNASGLLTRPEKFTGCALRRPFILWVNSFPIANCRLPIFEVFKSTIGNRKLAITRLFFASAVCNRYAESVSYHE